MGRTLLAGGEKSLPSQHQEGGRLLWCSGLGEEVIEYVSTLSGFQRGKPGQFLAPTVGDDLLGGLDVFGEGFDLLKGVGEVYQGFSGGLQCFVPGLFFLSHLVGITGLVQVGGRLGELVDNVFEVFDGIHPLVFRREGIGEVRDSSMKGPQGRDGLVADGGVSKAYDVGNDGMDNSGHGVRNITQFHGPMIVGENKQTVRYWTHGNWKPTAKAVSFWHAKSNRATKYFSLLAAASFAS